jgi:cyclase
MTLRKRIVVCLEVEDGRVLDLSGGNEGEPAERAIHYEREGADEIVFLDRSATPQGRRLLLDSVRRTAEQLFIPLTVAGELNDISEIGLALRAGADKVGLNTSLIAQPELLTEAATRFGSECIVAGIDARAERRQIEMLTRPEGSPAEVTGAAPLTDWFRVFSHAGRTATQLDAVVWARQCVELGAGEILLTSIGRGGQQAGYDLEMTARVVEAVSVPVIASGGASTAAQVRDVFLLAGADAVAAGGLYHQRNATVAEVKQMLYAAGVPVRIATVRTELNEQQLP